MNDESAIFAWAILRRVTTVNARAKAPAEARMSKSSLAV